MAVRRVVLATLLAVLCSCDSSGAEAGGGGDGTERGACYGNGSCNPGLLCLSNRCVRPPGADCDAVGEHLTSLELGNYAPKDQRKGRVLALAAVCRAQHMTKDEGACLLEKTSKDTLGYCAKPLIVPVMSEDDRKAQTGLPAACNEYVRLLERYASCPAIPPETQRALRQGVEEMKKSWTQIGGGAQLPKSVNDACKQGLDAMRQAMKSMGCP